MRGQAVGRLDVEEREEDTLPEDWPWSAFGYRVETHSEADDDTILCLGTKVLVPEEATMNQLGDTFNAFAAHYGGEFIRWAQSSTK